MIPTILQLRERIQTCRDESYRMLFTACYLLAMRIDEAVSITYPSDSAQTSSHGHEIRLTQETFTPDISNPDEYEPLMLMQLREKGRVDMAEIAQTNEPFAVFHIYTLKRTKRQAVQEARSRGQTAIPWTRAAARPLNPNFEPLTQQLVDYLQPKLEQHLAPWPIPRQKAFRKARELFHDFEYLVESYTRNKTPVAAHLKPLGNHGLRHFAAEELKNTYRFTPHQRCLFGGWTESSMGARSGSESRYSSAQDRDAWRPYAAKLLT